MTTVETPRQVQPDSRLSGAVLTAVELVADWVRVKLSVGELQAVFDLPIEWFPKLAAASPVERRCLAITDDGSRLQCHDLGVDVLASAFGAVIDYNSPRRYLVPARNVHIGALSGGPEPTYIDVSSGPDGLELRRARWEDAPLVQHPISGKPYRWLSWLNDMRPELSDSGLLVCEVHHKLLPADAVLTAQAATEVVQTGSYVPIDTPAAARAALDMLHLLKDDQSRANAKALIRAQLPDVVFADESPPDTYSTNTLLDLLAAFEALPDNPEAPTDGSINYKHYLYGLPKRS